MGTPGCDNKRAGGKTFVVDSAASMKMVSKRNFNFAELETMRTSKSPTQAMTANGELQTRKETIAKSNNWTHLSYFLDNFVLRSFFNSKCSQCYLVSLRCKLTLCAPYMRALVTCCTVLSGCPFKSHESQMIQSSQSFIYQGSGAGVTIAHSKLETVLAGSWRYNQNTSK